MDLTSKIAALQNFREYEELNWNGSFEDYLKIVRENPKVTRTAFQRVYDMILSYGQEEYIDNKKKLIRYNFFKDEQHGGRDAVYGLDIPLMKLVNVFKSAAQRYGIGEARHLVARPGRLFEVDDRAPAQEGARGIFAHARGRALHLRVDAAEGAGAHHGRARSVRFADARGSAAPDPGGLAREGVHRVWARQRAVPDLHRGRSESGVPADLPRADAALQGRLVEGDEPHARASGSSSRRRIASVSARSSRRTRRTRTRPSSPATSIIARSPSTARTRIRAPSTSTANSISPIAASSSSSKCSSSTWRSFTICSARRRSTRSSRRSSRRPTSTK